MLIDKYNTKENITRWQRFLKARGHDVQPDGIWGPKTNVATRNFQTIADLRVDGIVGDNTLAEAVKRGFEGFGQAEPPIVKKPVSTKLYLVSAGHTNRKGFDRGAEGNGLIEGIEAVGIRDRVAELMREKGLSVIEDGVDGDSEPLSKALVLARKADVAVEIHFNAGPPTATGVEVLARLPLAAASQKLGTAVADALGLPLRGNRGWKPANSGQHHRLAFCESGGMILEVCFISNAGDVAAYKANFEKLCKAIAEALV